MDRSPESALPTLNQPTPEPDAAAPTAMQVEGTEPSPQPETQLGSPVPAGTSVVDSNDDSGATAALSVTSATPELNLGIQTTETQAVALEEPPKLQGSLDETDEVDPEIPTGSAEALSEGSDEPSLEAPVSEERPESMAIALPVPRPSLDPIGLVRTFPAPPPGARLAGAIVRTTRRGSTSLSRWWNTAVAEFPDAAKLSIPLSLFALLISAIAAAQVDLARSRQKPDLYPILLRVTVAYPDPPKPPNKDELPPLPPISDPGEGAVPDLVYNIATPPELAPSETLQAIVDEAVALADERGLPVDKLSITLMDVKNGRHAQYQENALRYPASVAKLFWLVAFFARMEEGAFAGSEAAFEAYLFDMAQKSDNGAASVILDHATDTTSGSGLGGAKFDTWFAKRRWVNEYYRKAGFKGINLLTKNYPYWQYGGPYGRDREIWSHIDPKPNRATSQQAARLMYDIFTNRAVSPVHSAKMQELLTVNLDPDYWKPDPANVVAGFFGEDLPYKDIYFAAKVGLTSYSRQEVAYIATRDNRVAYVLSIFGDGHAYGGNWNIFPELSRTIYDRMVASPGKDPAK